MKATYKLNIENPCKRKAWNEMDILDRSRFCSLCSKSVFDLMNWTDHEIINFLNKSDKAICARLSHEQINKIISIKEKSKINNWQKIVISVQLMSSTNIYAIDKKVDIIEYFKQYNLKTYKKQIDKPNTIKSDTIKNKISGTLIELDSKNPIPNVTIEIKGTDIKTKTDSLGHFHFLLPKNYSRKEIVIFVNAGYGFEGQTERTVYKNELPISNLIIEKPNVLIGEVTCSKPKKWWQF